MTTSGGIEAIFLPYGYFRASGPFARSGAYVNFLTEDELNRVRSAYGPNCDRLAQVRRKHDPDNISRVNMNITPA